MTYATDLFTGDGSTVEFTLTFDFIQRDHVKVYRVVTATKVETELIVIPFGTPAVDQYVWESNTKIKVGTAPTSAQELKIVRETPKDQQLVDWQNGSYIVAEDLNTADRQFLFDIQELEDQIEVIDGSSAGGAAVKGVTGTTPITVDNTDPQNPIIGSDAVTAVTGTAPVSIDSSNAQQPDVSVDAITKAQAESDPTNPSWDTDDKLASAGAIDRVFKQVVGNGAGFPGSGNKAKDGQLRVDNTGLEPELYYWGAALGSPAWVQIATKGDKGDKGDTGSTGSTGPAPGLQSPAATATSVSLNSDGTVGTPTVSVTQDASQDLKFDFGVPIGERGPKGDTGSGVTYKGLIAAVTAAEPTNPNNGDFYVSSEAGTSSWAGTVLIGSRIVYNGGTSSWDTYDPVASQTLQQVTDLDNFTTTDIAIGNTASAPKIWLKNDGSAIYQAGIQAVSTTLNTAGNASTGLYVRGTNNANVAKILGNGNAEFTGDVEADGAISTGTVNTSSDTTKGIEFSPNGIAYIQNIKDSTGNVLEVRAGQVTNIEMTAGGAATFSGRLEANQGSFNADLGVVGVSGTDTAFFVRDAGQSGSPTTLWAQANGDLNARAVTAAGDIQAGVTYDNALLKGGIGNGTNPANITISARPGASTDDAFSVDTYPNTGTTKTTQFSVGYDGSVAAADGDFNIYSDGTADSKQFTATSLRSKEYIEANVDGTRADNQTVFIGYKSNGIGGITETSSITGAGSATFGGGARAVNGTAPSNKTAFVQIAGSTAEGIQISDGTNANISLSWNGTVKSGTISTGDSLKAGVNADPSGVIDIQRANGNGGKTLRVWGGNQEKASISSDGTILTGGRVDLAGNLTTGNKHANGVGALLTSYGALQLRCDDNSDFITCNEGSNSNTVFRVDKDGDVTTPGRIQTTKDIYIPTTSANTSLAIYNASGASSSNPAIAIADNAGGSPKSITLNYDGDIETIGDVLFKEGSSNAWSLNIGGANSDFKITDRHNSRDALVIDNEGKASFLRTIFAGNSSNQSTGLFAQSSTASDSEPVITLRNHNSAGWFFTGYDSNANVTFKVKANGTIYADNTTVQPVSSERRLKENIVAIDSNDAWQTIKNTPYYAYNFIGKDATVYGPMADEVPADMVVQPMEENEKGVMVARADEQGPIRSYDNGMLQARLYTALQTALGRIESLEAEVNALKAAASS